LWQYRSRFQLRYDQAGMPLNYGLKKGNGRPHTGDGQIVIETWKA